MTRTVQALVAADTSGIVRNATIERRDLRSHDVDIEIKFCGICHSDLHQLRAEWAIDNYFPMVAGHEIVGIVNSVGEAVTRYAVGDRVGVGCFVDSCRSCSSCKRGMEQYCGGCPEKKDGIHLTYNCKLKDYGGELTFGGYSTAITVDENYVVRVPDGMELSSAAPLLCAGVTLFSPLSHFGCNTLKGKEMKVSLLPLAVVLASDLALLLARLASRGSAGSDRWASSWRWPWASRASPSCPGRRRKGRRRRPWAPNSCSPLTQLLCVVRRRPST